MHVFEAFPKVPRFNREIIVTEKIDGTNAQLFITQSDGLSDVSHALARSGSLALFAGSRNRYLAPESDNFGFAAWASTNGVALIELLGAGRHFGEWFGKGIQRGYGMETRELALFNTERWSWFADARAAGKAVPEGLTTVPTLYRGKMDQNEINYCLYHLKAYGSRINRFPSAEGIMVYHSAANHSFKITVDSDEKGKGQ